MIMCTLAGYAAESEQLSADRRLDPSMATAVEEEEAFTLLSRLGGSAGAVSAQGDLVYVTFGSGLEILDATDPSAPQEIGHYSLPGIATAVVVSDNTAFVLCDAVGLVLIDVSEPHDPQEIGRNEAVPYATDFVVDGSLVYVADGWDQGIFVIDAADASNPVQLSYFLTPGPTLGLALDGSMLLVAGGSYGLVALDISAPEAIVETGNLGFAYSVLDVAQYGVTAYVSLGFGGVRTVDTSDPGALVELGTFSPGIGVTLDLVVAGDLLLAASHDSPDWYILRMIDVSDPSNPYQVGSFAVGAWIESVDVESSTAYAAAGADGLYILNVTDPMTPTQLSHTYPELSSPSDVAIYGNTMFVSDQTDDFQAGRLVIFDLSNPSHPVQIGSVATSDALRSITVVGAVAYVGTWGYGKVLTIDVSDLTSPTVSGVLDTPGFPQNIAVVAMTAYVADDTSGLTILDVSDPAAPSVVGSWDDPTGLCAVRDVVVVDNMAYLTVTDATYYGCDDSLVVIDVTDPANPVERGRLFAYEAYGVAAVSSTVYVAGRGLRIVDASQPEAPTLISSFDSTPHPSAVALHDQTAFLSAYSLIRAVDVSDPTTPGEKTSFGAPSLDSMRRLDVSDEFVAVVLDYSGVMLFRCCTDGTEPVAEAGGPYSGTVGQPVNLDGSGSYDTGGAIVQYEWDVDSDGVYDYSAADPTVWHTYAAAFDDQVTLRVTDNDGLTAMDTASIVILPAPVEPVAEAGGPYEGTIGRTVLFSAVGSYDSDGTIVLYEWDMDGDSIYDYAVADPTVTHTYSAAFDGQVTLRVTDDDGLTNVDSADVEIRPNMQYLPIIIRVAASE